jgi:hypothetical protein
MHASMSPAVVINDVDFQPEVVFLRRRRRDFFVFKSEPANVSLRGDLRTGRKFSAIGFVGLTQKLSIPSDPPKNILIG